MIARSNNLGEWLMGREAVFANPDSQPWFKNASKYSSTISSFCKYNIESIFTRIEKNLSLI